MAELQVMTYTITQVAIEAANRKIKTFAEVTDTVQGSAGRDTTGSRDQNM